MMKKCFISRLTTCCTFIRHTANKDYDVKVAQYASARICRLTSVFSDFSSFACLYLTVENNLMIIPGNTDWLQWTLWDLWKLLASWYNLNYHLKPDIRETFNNEREEGKHFPRGSTSSWAESRFLSLPTDHDIKFKECTVMFEFLQVRLVFCQLLHVT